MMKKNTHIMNARMCPDSSKTDVASHEFCTGTKEGNKTVILKLICDELNRFITVKLRRKKSNGCSETYTRSYFTFLKNHK